MPRFASFKLAPTETRRLLRDRLCRRLALPTNVARAAPDAERTPDVLALQLLGRLDLSHGADWSLAAAAYGAAGPAEDEPPDLPAAADAGWVPPGLGPGGDPEGRLHQGHAY